MSSVPRPRDRPMDEDKFPSRYGFKSIVNRFAHDRYGSIGQKEKDREQKTSNGKDETLSKVQEVGS